MPKKQQKGQIADGEELRRLRQMKGWTQFELATAAELQEHDIQRAEAEEPKSVEHLQQIAFALTGNSDYTSLLKRRTLQMILLMLMEEAEKQGIHVLIATELRRTHIIIDGEAKNLILKPGSVIVQMDLTADDIKRVVAAFLDGKLSTHKVVSIAICETSFRHLLSRRTFTATVVPPDLPDNLDVHPDMTNASIKNLVVTLRDEFESLNRTTEPRALSRLRAILDHLELRADN